MDTDRFFEAICVAGFLAAVAYGGGRVIGTMILGMIGKKPETGALQALIERRSTLERGLADRLGERRRVMAELDREIKILVLRRTQLNQAQAAAEESPDRVLRSLGQEIKGAQAYVALVLNKYVKSGGGGKSPVDPVWATAQEVEVWAKSIAEARGELDRRYPDAQGFKVTSLTEVVKKRGA